METKYTACGACSTKQKKKKENIGKEVQEKLLAYAAKWKLPEPSPTAKLVKIRVHEGTSDKEIYVLGFLEDTRPCQALVGFYEIDISKFREVKEVPDPENLSLADISCYMPGFGMSCESVDVGFLTGIQLLRAGKEKTALALISRAVAKQVGIPYERYPEEEPAISLLAKNGLRSANAQLLQDNPDYEQIKQRIEAILKDFPRYPVTYRRESLLVILDATVQHKPSVSGTVDGLIDDYMQYQDCHGMTHDFRELGDAERALVLKGFAAIPKLLERRNSIRFTNHLRTGFNIFLRMQEDAVVNAYLRRFFNNELGVDWLREQNGKIAGDEVVHEWWSKASEMGERAYVAKYAVVHTAGGGAKLSRELLLIAQERYPDLIPELYTAILQTSSSSYDIAEAVVRSNLHTEKKLELLDSAIKTNSESHRNFALRFLQEINGDAADIHLIRILKNASGTTKGEYRKDQDAVLGVLVGKSQNQQVWTAFHDLLDRSDLGMQMELIDQLYPPSNSPPQILRSYYAVYDKFRNDKRVRDETSSKNFSGPAAGFPYTKIAIRDFVSVHWACWLKLDIRPPEKYDGTPQLWSAYRAHVSKTIENQRAELVLDGKDQ